MLHNLIVGKHPEKHEHKNFKAEKGTCLNAALPIRYSLLDAVVIFARKHVENSRAAKLQS